MRKKLRILIAGLGGAGCNALSYLAKKWPDFPDTLAIDTDAQVLEKTALPRRILLGGSLAQGYGVGGDLKMGEEAAQRDEILLNEAVADYDVLFLVIGLGCGTGTGAAPIVVNTAQNMGLLVFCFVTLPFFFEGAERRRLAEEGLQKLRAAANAVISLPNQRMFEWVTPETSIESAFHVVNKTMVNHICVTANILTHTGIMNLNVKDYLRLLELSNGLCVMGYGEAAGPEKVDQAVREIKENPVFGRELTLNRADGIMVGIMGGPNLSLVELESAVNGILFSARADVRLFLGAAIYPNWDDKIGIAVLASEMWMPEKEVVLESNQEKELDESDKATDQPTKASGKAVQTTLKLDEIGDKGRFKDVQSTLHEGEDLDIPTFIRRGIKLGRYSG